MAFDADETTSRTETLTRDMLDLLIDTLTTVLEDHEVWATARQRTSLIDALRQADHLYPIVVARESRYAEVDWWNRLFENATYEEGA